MENIQGEQAELQAVLALKNQQIALLESTLKERDLHIANLKHELATLKRSRYGATSENAAQLELMLEAMQQQSDTLRATLRQTKDTHTPPSSTSPNAPAKKKPKRNTLPEHLERRQQHIPLCSPDCESCGTALHILEQKVTEELDYIPGRFVVNQIIRPRAVCRHCETMTEPPLPSRVIERGRPTAGLLSHVILSKYMDHLPLYRLSGKLAREGITLERSTMAGWLKSVAELLLPLTESIRSHVLAGQALFADDTVVKYQAPGKGKTATGRIWSYSRDERNWNEEAHPAVWYQFSQDRKGEHPTSHLEGFEGWMHADGYAGFNPLYRNKKVGEVACLAHMRRKFTDILISQPTSTVAKQVIADMAELYQIEAEIRGMPPDERKRIRQEQAKPRLKALKTYLTEQYALLSVKTPLARAIHYCLARMDALAQYLEHGILEIDNNAAERSMRPIAVGRKNWLFAGSVAGGERAAIFYSLIETAKLNQVNPHLWLTNVLTRLPDHNSKRVHELLPWNWKMAQNAS